MADPTIALALGGGGARGIAHIPVFEVLDEFGLDTSVIAGTSIGSLMGAGYANGLSGAEIRALVIELFSSTSNVLSKVWRLRPSSWSDLRIKGQLRIGELDVEKIIDVFLGEVLPENFEDLKIPFTAVATDYYAHKEVHLNSGKLLPALAASSAIPAVFRPMHLNGAMYIDGGMCNPLPIDLVAGKADILIGVDVVGAPEGDPNKYPSKIDVLFGSSQLMMQSITNMKLKHTPVDIILRPSVNEYRVLDFLKTEKILEETEGFKDSFRRDLEHLLINFKT
jgi:NTE family protein